MVAEFKRLNKLALISLLSFSVMLSAQTPSQIVSAWSFLSENQGGKVVYGNANKVWVLDLETGLKIALAAFALANTQWGLIASYKFSPDGTRIAVQNNQQLIVMNADGSAQKVIWQGSINWDLIAHSWDGDSAVVYSTYATIVKTQIHADNSAGLTTTLISTPVQKGYASVEKCGNYLGYVDIGGNTATGGYHRPCVKNLATGVVRDLVPRSGDGCTVRLRPDSTGVVIFNYGSHTQPAPIMDFNLTQLDKIAPVNNSGMCGMRWSNTTQFLVHNGDRIVTVPTTGGTTVAYAWIRKVSTKENIFLGDSMYWPDLWVGKTVHGNVDLPKISPDVTAFTGTLSVTLACTTSAASIRYTLDGSDPLSTSALYTQPLNIVASTLVRTRGFKQGMLSSNISEKRYIFGKLKPASSVTNVQQGLTYTYYEGQYATTKEYTNTTVLDSGAIDSFDISSRNGGNYFAFCFNGYISIPADDNYKFYLNSDEGSMLYIDDSLVVNNDGIHTLQEKSGSIGLSSGYHDIRVVYFDATGPEQLDVMYSSAAFVKKGIPKSVLFSGIARPSVVLLNPITANQYAFGDTVKVCWKLLNGNGLAAVVALSLNNGKSFSIEPFSAPFAQVAEQRDTFFIIPSDVSYLSNSALIKVYMYGNADIYDQSPVAFSIVQTSPVTHMLPTQRAQMRKLEIGKSAVLLPATLWHDGNKIAIYTSKGQCIAQATLQLFDGNTAIKKAEGGCSFITITSKSGNLLASQKIAHVK